MPKFYVRPTKEVMAWKKRVGNNNWWEDGRLAGRIENYKITSNSIVIPSDDGSYDEIDDPRADEGYWRYLRDE